MSRSTAAAVNRVLWEVKLDIPPRDIFIKFGYVLLHQLDLVLTVQATSAGFLELNPLMNSILASPLHMVAVKVLAPLLIAWLVPGRLLVPAVLLLLGVMCWNLKELFMLLV